MKYKEYRLEDGVYDLQGDGKLFADICYKNASEKNKLDLYMPSVKKEKYPVVIFVHGGGFIQSDKSHHLSGILNILQDGYAVVSVNYRLNNEMIYPENLQDCIDALTFLGENSKKFNLDNRKIILWGETHGGFLASAIGIQYHTTVNYKIAGVISFYAPIDLYAFHQYQISSNQLMKMGDRIADEVSFGKKGASLLSLLKSYDILSKIDGTQPPFYLLHGKKDSFVPLEFSYRFAETLAQNGVPLILDIVEDGTHGIDYYACEKHNKPIRKFINNRFLG